MNLSVELSMYPLQDGYKPKIEDFLTDINRRASDIGGIELRSSNMSTRIFGEYADVMQILNLAMQRSMSLYGKIVFVAKFLEGDARELEAYD